MNRILNVKILVLNIMLLIVGDKSIYHISSQSEHFIKKTKFAIQQAI